MEYQADEHHHLITQFFEASDISLTPPLSPLHGTPVLPEPKPPKELPPGVFFTKSAFEKYSWSRRSLEKLLSTPSVPASQPSETIPTQITSTTQQTPPTQQVPLNQQVVKQNAQKKVTYSSLSRRQHQQYLELEQMYILDQSRVGQPSLFTPELLSQFYKLRTAVVKEQEKYRRALFTEMMERKEVYHFIHPQIHKQLESIFERKRKRIEKYARFYEIDSTIDMRLVKPAPGDPILRHKATVLQTGKCLLFRQPTSPEISLNREYYPATPPPEPKTTWTKKEMPSLLEDPNIPKIVAQHNVNVVVCSSAMVTMVDNHEPRYWESWELPVTITSTQPTQNASEKIKTVYIEKPFIKKKMTEREENNYFFNIAFKTLGLQLPTAQQRSVEFDQPIVRSASQEQMNASAENQTVSGECKANGSGEQKEVKEEQKLCLTEDNLTYNLWQFGDMTVLVRCKIHGFVPKAPQGLRYVGIKTKLEYFPEKGREEITMSETAQGWIYTFLRPDAHLILGHVNVSDSSLLEVEQKDMPSILPPGCLFKPEKASKLLYVIMDKLKSFPEGNYLLVHKSEDPNVTIWKSIPEKQFIPSFHAQYDLHTAHKASPITDSDTLPLVPLRWIPKPNQIPDTFPIDLTKFTERPCKMFAKLGKCNNPVHLTKAQIKQQKKAVKQKKKRKRALNPTDLDAETLLAESKLQKVEFDAQLAQHLKTTQPASTDTHTAMNNTT